MQKFQQLIHQAFSKINAADAKKRQAVYENIWLMHEQTMAAQNRTEAQKQERRRHLTQLLKTVEVQYRAQMQPPAAARPAAAQQKPQAARPNRDLADSGLKAERSKDSALYYLEQEVNRKVPQAAASAPSLFRRIKLSSYFIGVLSLLVAIFVAWSFYNSFGHSGAARRQQALSTAPMQQNDYGKNGWVEVFNPANVSGLAVQGQAAANLHNEPDANFIRISTEAADDAAIIDIGLGALRPLRGKTATFKLVARNAGNIIGQLNLTADFGAAPPARYQFELSPTAAPLLFRLHIPAELNQAAKFYLSSGADSSGKPQQADIFSLLVQEETPTP